jgi:hypothetical protein
MSTYLHPKKTQKRKRGRNPIVDGELDSARAVTHTKVTVINDDGTVDVKRVIESLDTPKPTSIPNPKRPEMPDQDYEMDYEIDNMSSAPNHRKAYRVGIFYIKL